MRQLPVPVRVGILGTIGITLMRLSIVTLPRLLSDAPALIIDSDGVEGYKNNTSGATLRLRWDEIGEISTYYGHLSIYSKRENMSAKRKQIVVHAHATGKSGEGIVAIMQTMMLSIKLSGASARQASPAPASSTPVPSDASAAMAPRSPHVPQVVIRTAPAMANAAKPTFGTRRI